LTEHCPNCRQEVELKQLQGKDLLDPIQSILCVIIPLITALGAFACIQILEDVFHFLLPLFGIICIVFAIMVLAFVITLRFLIAFEKNKLKSLGVSIYHLDCSCMPQNHIIVVRPITTFAQAVSFILNAPETLD